MKELLRPDGRKQGKGRVHERERREKASEEGKEGLRETYQM